MGGFVEQHYWAFYAADFAFRSVCYVVFAALLVVIAHRLRPPKLRPPKLKSRARPVRPAIILTKPERYVELEVECVARVSLKPSNPCPCPGCGCCQQWKEITRVPHSGTDSDPPKASE